ncbi:MAG: bifunctional molybdenum cofactor biosynthesis protein MoaC/MoaB [Cyclobacteriaceae bacterium]|nr:bifunctional molybdenum cofactor biosynthesis protein MoaC/MoaB [Cyclobacteriaceae bacterium]
MIDITHKSNTLRHAVAEAIVVVGKKETMDAIKENKVPKGNVLEVARTAGLFGVKHTSNMIPDCHPLPIEYTAINYEFFDLSVKIIIEVKTIYKTGVEVEAMHGASVVALTMYDMLKPIDKNVEIQHIKLVNKTGGKSDYKDLLKSDINAGLLICSSAVQNGKKENKITPCVKDKLNTQNIELKSETITGESSDEIKTAFENILRTEVDLIVVSGGTGIAKKDISPEIITPYLERTIPGAEELMRDYGQNRSPYAMFSRSKVGVIGNKLILLLPGSSNGIKESMDALFPYILHVFRSIRKKQ